MDTTAYEAGKAAYQQGDWARAAQELARAKQPGEAAGAVDHLLGNALMKLGRYDEAAQAYADALLDAAYGKVGALGCNRGRALSAAGRNEEAVAALTAALEDASYATPYKAQMALGKAQEALGDARAAGAAYRSAAIDESNPDPSRALTSLGECFMQLGRPVDAIEAYRTALDFSAPEADQAPVYALLGDAYGAANRTPEAVDAYGKAVEGGCRLTPTQNASYEAARRGMVAIQQRTASETDDLLQAAGYGQGAQGGYDPLDPLGKSGEFIPSPEDTGFFTVSEEDLISQDAAVTGRKKHGHGLLKVLLVVLVLLLLLAGAAGFAYYRGYGWPTQQAVAEGLFAAAGDGDVGSYLASDVSSEMRREIELVLPEDATVTVEGIDQDMSSSTLLVTAELAEGGEQSYRIGMVRDGISWKVASVELVFGSQGEGATDVGADASDQAESPAEEAGEGSATDEGAAPSEDGNA